MDFLKSVFIQAPVNKGMKDVLLIEASIHFATLYCMHKIQLLDDVGQKKNEKSLKNGNIMSRSVNPHWKGFPQTCVAAMVNTREAFFSSVEK